MLSNLLRAKLVKPFQNKIIFMTLSGDRLMIILSSPSGVGKTTITKKLQQKYQNLKISISHTTRSPRSNEIDGIDYNFITKKKFEELINKRKFYEYAKIFENYYGTLKQKVDELSKDYDILFDIDWQGTKQLSKFKNLKLIKIFLITNSKDELKKRLLKRDQNTKNEVEKRFNSFDEDVKHWKDYDYILINKNLESCFKQVEQILFNHKEKHFNFFQTVQ